MECLEGATSWPTQTYTRTIFLPQRSNASGSSYRNWHTEVQTARLSLSDFLSFLFGISHVHGLQQMPLCEASQIRQAVSLAGTAHHRRARTGHLTHIGPLFCHHCLTLPANLIGLYASWTFRANFLHE